MDRYDDGWVGRFCQEVDVLLGIKVVLLKKYVFPRRKKLVKKNRGFDKRQRFSYDEIKVLPRGRGLPIKYKNISETKI
jgi:hypothetical protein